MKNKWHRLLNQLEVFGTIRQKKLWTKETLEEFEQKNRLLLPEDYKLFLQVFGLGMLGEYIAIYLPTNRFFKHYWQPNQKPHNDLVYFGYIKQQPLLFWDLRTYSDLDKSYDIYLTLTEETGNSYYDQIPYKIGRNFYYFVRDFCLGNSFYELFTKSIYLDPQIFVHTFFPIKKFYSGFDQSWQNRQEQIREQRKLITFYFNLPYQPDFTLSCDEHYDEVCQRSDAVEEKLFYALFRYLKSFRTHLGAIYCVKFTPDGQTLVTASGDTTIKLWALTNYQETFTLTGHTQAVLSLAISPDNNILASGSADNTVRVWNLKTGEEINTLIGHSNSVLSLAISPDGQTLASSGADTTIKLWNLSTGELRRTLTSHTESVLSIAISPDGKILASASADSTLRLWNLSTGEEICTLQEKKGIIFALNFYPSQNILVSGSEEGNLKIWNLSSFELINTINTHDKLLYVVISPDEKHFACTYQCSPFRGARIWELETGKIVTYFEERVGNYDEYPSVEHCDSIYSVAFSPDGQLIATGSGDTTAKLWGIPPSLEHIE